MKKEYKKPQIIYESFELSQSIAGGCEFVSNAQRGICSIKMSEYGWDDETVLTESMCIIGVIADDQLCYDVPAPSSRVYSS